MALLGIVVVHDHRIDTQLDHSRSRNLQPPDEKPLQQASKQKHPRPGKGFEEPFDLVRRGHVCLTGFDAAGIPIILAQLVEIGQPTAGAVNKEAQCLLEQFRYGQPFAVFADGAKPAIEPAEDLNTVQVGHKQCQARSAGQPIGGGFDASNFQFLLPVIFAMFANCNGSIKIQTKS